MGKARGGDWDGGERQRPPWISLCRGVTVKVTGALGQWEVLGKFAAKRKVGAACVLSICPLWEFPRAVCSLLAPE